MPQSGGAKFPVTPVHNTTQALALRYVALLASLRQFVNSLRCVAYLDASKTQRNARIDSSSILA